MTPNTRSGGAPPTGRVYQSTPSLRQVQFPARRKKVRYEQFNEPPTSSSAERLRQQTLTQIDFVSSFTDEDDVIAMSDSDADNDNQTGKAAVSKKSTDGDSQKENRMADEDDDEPTSRRRKRSVRRDAAETSKRRRTMGDDISGNMRRKDKSSRRRTLGDSPAASKYHTQTLTQFVGRDSFIADSDEDDNGFLDWLGADSESPSMRVRHANISPNKSNTATEPIPAETRSREESVIPQTPVKSIRFELPPSRQQSTPLSVKIARYGPPDVEISPSQGRNGTPLKGAGLRNKLVIEDSYTTDSWGSPEGTPTNQRTGLSQRSANTTPTKLPLQSQMEDVTPKAVQQPTSSLAKKQIPDEIPDSDEEDGFTQDVAEEQLEDPMPLADEPTEDMPEVPEVPEVVKDAKEDTAEALLEDVAEAEEVVKPNNPETTPEPHTQQETYTTGNETQLIMDQLQCSVSQWSKPAQVVTSSSPSRKPDTSSQQHITSSIQTTQTTAPFSSAKEHPSPSQPKTKRLRQPIQHPAMMNTQGMPLESQRVAVSILHSFPPVFNRSDILLPISSSALNSLLEGYKTTISMPFKIPKQVVRFWLLDQHNLQTMATIDEPPEKLEGDMWDYKISQVYELNNPVSEDDMRAEEWIDGKILKYTYLPPVYVSQLLWNLRHAVFSDTEQDPTPTQLPPNPPNEPSSPVTTGIIPSTHSDEDETLQTPQKPSMPPPTFPASQHKTPKPPTASQATTASQASVYHPASQLPSYTRHTDQPPDTQAHPSSDSVVFIDPSGSSLQLPDSLLDHNQLGEDGTFQLLTKSQMLPDSLIRDDIQMPNEIWNSDEE